MDQEHNVTMPGKDARWVTFIKDPAAKAIVTNYAQKKHHVIASFLPKQFPVLADWISAGLEPDFIFIEISDMSPPFTPLNQLIEGLPEDIEVILIGIENHIGRYRWLQKMGIKEYLYLPLNEELLEQACTRVKFRKSDSKQRIKTLVPVIGVRGGSGATTIAINFAYNWSVLPNQRVCLLDLDTQASDIALTLDIHEHDGLQDALTETERVDNQFINSMIAEKTKNLFVITNNWSHINPYDDSHVSDLALNNFLKYLYERVDSIFVDLSFPLNKKLTNLILAQANFCLLVTDLTLSAARDIVNLLQWIKMHAPDLDLKIIANISRPSKNTYLIQQSMEKAIERKIDIVLPYCNYELQKSTLDSQILSEKSKKLAFVKNLRQFTEDLARQIYGHTPPKKSLLGRLRDWL